MIAHMNGKSLFAFALLLSLHSCFNFRLLGGFLCSLFLFGFLGLFIVFILGMRQPATVRIEMLKWAGVGFAAAIAVEFTFLFLYGDQISGMLGALGAAPTGTGSGGGSVF